MPFISFIITYHNQTRLQLKSCLESLTQLPFRQDEHEIIVVDDGSNVPFFGLLPEMQGKVDIIQQANQGVSCARNNGIEASNGKYIQFIDADDKINSLAYAECLQILNKEHPDILAFNQPFRLTHKQQKRQHCTGIELLSNYHINGAVWAYAIKRSLFDNISFSNGRTFAEDEEVVTKLLLKSHDVYVLSTSPYLYLPNNSSVTSQQHLIQQRLSDHMAVVESLYTESSALPQAQRSALLKRCHYLSTDLLYNTIRMTHDMELLESAVNKLKVLNLFPIPLNDKSVKHNIFRWLLRFSATRRIMNAISHLMSNP